MLTTYYLAFMLLTIVFLMMSYQYINELFNICRYIKHGYTKDIKKYNLYDFRIRDFSTQSYKYKHFSSIVGPVKTNLDYKSATKELEHRFVKHTKKFIQQHPTCYTAKKISDDLYMTYINDELTVR